MKAENSFPVKNLATTFKERDEALCNRASCLFPVYLSDKQDTHLIFLNYWTIKNYIAPENLLFNIRVRKESGELIYKDPYCPVNSHNQISIKSLLQQKGGKIEQEFAGTVELEVISTSNLRYAFPAVTVVYQSNELFSAVHSAGRIKNTDENQDSRYTRETNWNCKFDRNVTPFFHYFVGPATPKNKTIEVAILNFEGQAVKKINVDISHLSPFGCETFFADSLFDVSGLDNSYFMSVQVEHNSIYPRLIVGNFFKIERFYEVTHSYPLLEELDYCPVRPDDTYQSTICAFSTKGLDLILRSFPTFNRPQMLWDTYVKSYEQTRLYIDESNDPKSVKRFFEGRGSYSLNEDNEFVAFCLKGKNTPARMTISYQYSVSGIRSPYSTDISDGAKACIFPPKITLWGHGLISNEFDTLIFLRNKSHTPNITKPSRGKLRVFSNFNEMIFDIEIDSETLKVIKLRDLVGMPDVKNKEDVQFLSWVLNMDQPTCDTFWVSFNGRTGSIFGDHGF